jgi:cytochrome c5
MGDHDDKVFLKRFSGIIAGLVIVTILIIIIAVGNDSQEEGNNPSREALAEQRIQPVGNVRTSLPAAQPDPAPVVTEDPGTVAMVDTGIDGEAIYNSTCLACHLSGAAGAPIPGSDAWAERAAKGADALTATAISGIGIMPPKGGRMDLSDEEIRAAVDHMLAQ